MFVVYILRSKKTGRHYTGYTQNLEERLRQHNAGKTRSLKNRGPYEVVYTELSLSESEAKKRELEIKRYKGGNAFKRLLERKYKEADGEQSG